MADEKKITTRKEARLVDRKSMTTGEVRTTSPTSRQVQSRLLGNAGRKAGLNKTQLKTAKANLPTSTVRDIESKSNAVASRSVTARDANNASVLRDNLNKRNVQYKVDTAIKRSLDAEYNAKNSPIAKVKAAGNVVANTAKAAGKQIASDPGRVLGGKIAGTAALVFDEQPSFQQMKRTRADIVPAYRNRPTPRTSNKWVVGKDGNLRFVAGKK